MPPIATQNAAPSNLAAVIGQVGDALGALADATPCMIGKHYLEHFGAGSPPRVLFVPETRGKVGPPTELGFTASITHACDVFVRGPESGDDLGRFDAAYALGDLVIDLIQTAGTGRIEWTDYADGSPTNVDAFGADLAFSFTYTRNVRHDARRWALPAATADTSTKVPNVPPGVPSSGATIDVTTVPQE